MALHHLTHTAAAERLQERPGWQAAGPPRQLRHERRGDAVATLEHREIGRPGGHGPHVRLGVADDSVPGIERRLQPLVAVGDPGLGALNAGSQRPELLAGARPEAEGGVDVQPGAVFAGDLDERPERDRRRRC